MKPVVSIDSEDDVIVKVAQLYYLQDLNLKEIADRLNISYSTVSRLLKKGKQRGLISIVIKGRSDVLLLEKELAQKFGLKDAFVAEVMGESNSPGIKRRVGEKGAQCLAMKLRDGNVLGISIGETVRETINKYQPSRKLVVDVVQLEGNRGPSSLERTAVSIFHKASTAFAGNCHFLHASAIYDNEVIRNVVLSDSSISRVINMFSKVDVALISVGAIQPALSTTMIEYGYLRGDEVRKLQEMGVVVDVCMNFLNRHGEPVKDDISDRCVGIDLEMLRSIKNVIVVSGGADKALAMNAVLRSGIVDSVVIDEPTAAMLVSDSFKS